MKALSFDTETRGLRWDLPDEAAFLVTWADAAGTYWADLDEDPDGVARFLNDIRQLKRGDRLWGHNLKIDLHMIRESTGFDILEWAELHGIELWDTLSVDQVLNPSGQTRGGHGLKDLDAKYLEGKAKQYDERLAELAGELDISLKSTPAAYYQIYQAYPDEMRTYAMQDARSTFDIGEYHLLPQYHETPAAQQGVVQLEREVLPVIYLAEHRGVATDQAEVAKFHRQFTKERRDILDRIHHELGDDVLLEGEGSRESLREALLKHGVPLVDKNDDGTLSTSRAALAPFTDEFPVLADLSELRRVERFLNTYIEPALGREVIHTDFQQNEAWTGRMSSRRPNMQNWPQRAGKEVRNVLVARPGYVLAVADFSQMEAVIVIRYLNDPRMIEAIKGGLDLNSWMAAQIWGGEPADWSKHGPKAEGEQSRKTARHTLYATMYGAGGRRVTQQLPFLSREPYYAYDEDGILRDERGNAIAQRAWKKRLWPEAGWQYAEARALIGKVKSSLPGWWDFNRRLGKKIDTVGYINTYYGRKNPVNPDKKYVAVAAIVQGTGADVLKLAAVRARRMLEPFDGQIIMFTHDELVAEIPEANGDVALAALVEAMEGAAPDHDPPFKASGALLHHYGDEE